jgi:hypothetical protein
VNRLSYMRPTKRVLHTYMYMPELKTILIYLTRYFILDTNGYCYMELRYTVFCLLIAKYISQVSLVDEMKKDDLIPRLSMYICIILCIKLCIHNKICSPWDYKWVDLLETGFKLRFQFGILYVRRYVQWHILYWILNVY